MNMGRLIICVLALIYSIIYTAKPKFFLERVQKRYPKLDEDGSGEEKPVIEVNEKTIGMARKCGYVLIAITSVLTLFCIYKLYFAN